MAPAAAGAGEKGGLPPGWVHDHQSWARVKALTATAAAAASSSRGGDGDRGGGGGGGQRNAASNAGATARHKPKPKPKPRIKSSSSPSSEQQKSGDTSWDIGATVPWATTDVRVNQQNGRDPFAADNAGGVLSAKKQSAATVVTAAEQLDQALSRYVGEKMSGRDEPTGVTHIGRSSEKLRGLERASERP